MLTIFSTPKAFRSHLKIIQTNAIRSWVLLQPECEVILLGNDEGTAEIAAELGIRHVPEVECNEHGTPLVSSLFSNAQDIASHDLMCYVNADVILMDNLLQAVSQIKLRPFLLVGQRWDIDLTEPINFGNPDWATDLLTCLRYKGKLHGPSGLDYFVFTRGLYHDIPPFAIGRPGWDNWMIYRMRSMKVPVIDATKVITAVHQNHDYSHHPEGTAGVWKGPERDRSIELMSGPDYAFTLEYATWILTPQGIRRALTLRHLYFWLESMTVLVPILHFIRIPKKVLTRLLRTIRSVLNIAIN